LSPNGVCCIFSGRLSLPVKVVEEDSVFTVSCWSVVRRPYVPAIAYCHLWNQHMVTYVAGQSAS